MASSELLGVGTAISLMLPAVVIRPTLLPPPSTKQRLPSGPAVTPCALLLAVGRVVSAMAPTAMLKSIVSAPGLLLASSVACRSEPAAVGVVRDGEDRQEQSILTQFDVNSDWISFPALALSATCLTSE
jgi:hypothetical protein